jgi:hypothetical protein
MVDLICYCLDCTAEDILRDFDPNGRSLIMEKIMDEMRSGGCDCAKRNPKGR